MKVAIVHELLTVRGGAERVAKIFADLFPEAPVYTLLYNEKLLGDWFPRSRVRSSRLQRWAGLSTNHHWYLPFFPGAVEAWDFCEFDVVLSSSSAFAHGILTNSRPRHVCYVHSPARYLWDRTHDVLGRSPLLLHRALSKTFHDLRRWDADAGDRPDTLLAASKTVQRRIELYWRRQSAVVTPPIDDFWLHQPARSGPGAYDLVVSTLATYKRIDIAIEAANRLKRTLVIVGRGPAEARLRAIAGPTVRFAGHVEGIALRDLYAGATALLVPGEEDFGLAPLEAMACGTPVIAYGRGGATETVKHGVAGLLYADQTPDALADAIGSFGSMALDPETCRAAAAAHGRPAFERAIREAVEHAAGER